MSEPDEERKKSAEQSWGLVVDLGEAVDRGDAQAVAALIRSGADTEAVEELEDPTVLMRAAEAGNIVVVRALVEGGANVNAEACDEDLDRFLDDDEAEAVGSSVCALLYAALRQRREVYDYLHPLTKPALRRKVERALKAVGRRGKPKRDRGPKALVQAARNGKSEEVRTLLESGVDVNSVDAQTNSGLWYAVGFNHAEIAEMLLAAGADPNKPNREGAIPLGHVQDPALARRLLAAGANPNARGGSGYTPLMFAAISRSAELVRTLIEGGADPNAANFEGQTALILAAERGMTENVVALIAGGAGLWACDQRGLSAYRAARWRRQLAVMDVLREAGAVRESTLELFRASAAGQTDEVKRLLAAGADARDLSEPEPDFELTALHAAARAGHVDVVHALIAAGADANAKTQHFTDRLRRELTPLLLAAAGGHARVVQALIEAGAKPDATSIFLDRETPLMRAADGGHLDAVRLLLRAGADPRREGGAENLDSLTRAERNGHLEVAEFLRRGRPA